MKVRTITAIELDIEVPLVLAEKLAKVAGFSEAEEAEAEIEKLTVAALGRLRAGENIALAGVAFEGFSAICAGCGCTDDEACEGGCSWAEFDLCSACLTRTCRNCQQPIRFLAETADIQTRKWVHVQGPGGRIYCNYYPDSPVAQPDIPGRDSEDA